MTPTPDVVAAARELMALVNRYAEACEDLSADLFNQTEEQTRERHERASAIYAQIKGRVDAMAAAEQRAEAAEADAARYRWLLGRTQAYLMTERAEIVWACSMTRQEAGAAIDADMKQGEQPCEPL